MTIDFLLRHKNYVAKLLKNNSIDIWVVTKNKTYPEINAFKRYYPDESDSPNGENMIKKWKDLSSV